MQAILQTYQDRLVNITGRNRSLVLRRLYKKRAFDMEQLNAFYPEHTSNFLTYLSAKGRKAFSLLDDPYRDYQENEKNIKDRLEEQYKENQRLLVSSLPAEELEHGLHKLEKQYQSDLAQALEKNEERHKALIVASRDLNTLYRETNSIERETGRQELFIGYPFVEGALFDKSFVRAPLLLFPVELVKDKNKWYLSHVEGASPQLNKVFVFAHAKANQSSPPEFEWELQTNTKSVEELVSLVLADLESHGVTISDTSTQEVERFPDYRKDNTPPYLPGTLFLKNHLILGQFPISNSIYDDYSKLKQRNMDEGPIASLLYTCDSSARNPFDETEEPIKETDHFFISPLDHSQEKALKKIGERNHLVIHGPPGTGKSETIANAIVDSLAKGKRVLMVSQKRAALDVVHSRLAPLHSKMVLIYDGMSDKKRFYQHVTDSLERIVQSPPSQSFSEAKTLSKQIDQELSLLQNSWIALNRVHELGLSLQQLYVKTSGIPRESLTGLLTKLRHSNPFKRLTYDDLISAKENLSQDDNLEAYVQYRSLNEIPFMSYVKPNVDKLGVLSVEQALQDIDVSKYDELKTNQLFTAVLHKLRDMDYPKVAERGEQMALEFVREQFPELLEPCHDGRWWTLGYWLSYRRMKKEQNRRALLHQKYMDEVLELMESIMVARETAYSEFKVLDEVFSPAGVKLFAEQLLEERHAHKVIGDIQSILQKAEYYSALQSKVTGLSLVEQILGDFVYENVMEQGEPLLTSLEKTIQAHLLFSLREHEAMTGAHTQIVDGNTYVKKTDRIQNMQRRKRQVVPTAIENDWSSRFLRDGHKYKQFQYHASKRSHLWPIRRYVDEFTREILNLFPCWLMGPEAVSDIFPLKPNLFDVIIFDEASQMFVENSIPAIYRAKQVVVAGDDRQLRPDDLFIGKIDDDVEEDSLESTPAVEVESLLDLAKVNFEGVHLNYHYRSRYAELINFSNYGFYRAQLQISPNLYTPRRPPIERIKVDGQWSTERNNLAEAEKVVEIIDHLMRTRKESETIGVVTFNHTQKELIQDLLDHQATQDPSFAAMYLAEQNRYEGDQDVGLFVKNIENVQGDERDIIIFSVGYGPDEHNRIRAHFGSLNREGGANRLNVAVSRAKKKVYLVTSIEPEELKVDHTAHDGPKLLKAYLDYAKAISEGDSEKALSILNGLLDTGVASGHDGHYDSEFEEQVALALRHRGYDIRTQIGVSGYRIDLGVYDPASSRFILGIECDGATYHSSKSARERDIQRQAHLESRGWTMARVWSTEWWKNPKDEIRRLVSIIEREKDKHKKIVEQTSVEIGSVEVAEETNRKDEREESPKKTKNTKSRPERQEAYYQASLFSFTDLVEKISYGDKVWLASTDGAIVFPIEIEENPHNAHLMKDYERELLGKRLHDEIEIKGYSYIINRVEPARSIS